GGCPTPLRSRSHQPVLQSPWTAERPFRCVHPKENSGAYHHPVVSPVSLRRRRSRDWWSDTRVGVCVRLRLQLSDSVAPLLSAGKHACRVLAPLHCPSSWWSLWRSPAPLVAPAVVTDRHRHRPRLPPSPSRPPGRAARW